MEIEVFRDWVIIVTGLVVTAAVVLRAFISYSAYRRVNNILKSAETSVAKIEALTTIITERIGSPLVQAASLIQAIGCEIRAIGKIFGRGG